MLKGELEAALMDDDRQLRPAVRSAVEETDRIIALAEDLLVLARAEEDARAPRERELSAAQLLYAVREQYEPLARRAGRALTIDIANGVRLQGDPERLHEALANLVQNALRYGRGPICAYTRQRTDRVEIHVTDEGPGFPAAFLPHAFERFTRADTSRGRGGFGLGLSIVQAVAQTHRGRADAANRPGGGADVLLTLPRSAERISA